MIDDKVCTKCQESKPVSEFAVATKARDGLSWWCKDCFGIWHKKRAAKLTANPVNVASKTCKRCKTEKHAQEFSRSSYYSDALDKWCKLCKSIHYQKTRVAVSAYSKKRLKENPMLNIDKHLWLNYGLTRADFYDMLAKQHGVCAICDTSSPGGRTNQWHVDHDHSCCPGTTSCGSCIRKLLCSRCNITLGKIQDSIELAKRMTCYLEDHLHQKKTIEVYSKLSRGLPVRALRMRPRYQPPLFREPHKPLEDS